MTRATLLDLAVSRDPDGYAKLYRTPVRGCMGRVRSPLGRALQLLSTRDQIN